MDFSWNLIIGMGHLLLVAALARPVRAGDPPQPQGPSSAPAAARPSPATADPAFPWYIILNSPQDLHELLLRIKRPDLILKADPPASDPARAGADPARVDPRRWVVDSVHVSGQLEAEFASLKVDFTITVRGAEPVWVSIRLDDHWLLGAREGGRDLELRRGDKKEWELKLNGDGTHRIQAELRVPVSVESARRTLSLAIPEAANTSLALDFSRNESDITIGAKEYFGQADRGDGKGTRLTAHLSPRSRLVVSWINPADSGVRSAPMLTAQGEIAIDIDPEQLRARSSWAIRCVRGTLRALEIRIDDEDEITELLLDDESVEEGSERVRGAGKLQIKLAEPLRLGAVKRLVFKTRRPFSSTAPRKISLTGFPLTDSREQSGFIGITQSPNIWVSPVSTQNVRRIDTSFLPRELRERPTTSMAFEFLDQPFVLDLGLEPAPPLVRAETRAIFWIDARQVRSQTTIELQWVRGRLFEVELGVAAGLQVVSVGPPGLIESSSLSFENETGESGAARARRLKIRLTPLAREPSKIALRLDGVQQIASEGPVKLGLFTRDQLTSVNASYALIAGPGISVELDDESGLVGGSSTLKFQGQRAGRDWPAPSLLGDASTPPLVLMDDGSTRCLPIRITRQARSVAQDTSLSAQVTRRHVEVLQQTTIAVHFGVLSTVEIRVPAAIGDRWELLEKEIVERHELGTVAEEDGSRRFRLTFGRPLSDRTTLRFRYRLPLVPSLEASVSREVSIPWISFLEGRVGPAMVELSLAPEILMEGTGGRWIRSRDDDRADTIRNGPTLRFTEEEAAGPDRPFTFTAVALDPVALPSIVVPRLLLKTVREPDGSIRNKATYWIETHGTDFPFALPAGARFVGARVDGRTAEAVDYDPSRSSYRLRFPGDLGSKSVLAELEYEASGAAAGSRWEAPQLLDGGVVLSVFWEVHLPWNQELVGIPSGWSDENQWYWDGYVWKQRPWRKMSLMNGWIVGSTGSATAIEDIDGADPTGSHRYLFSSTGQQVALNVWVVSRPWLVATCSGVTLLFGFFAIFSGIRFGKIWAGVAVVGVLAAALVHWSVVFLVLQSAFIGVVFTVLGLVIQRLLERTRSPSLTVRASGLKISQQTVESSLNRAPTVGSDDSTAIRVRAPSTMDFVPASSPAPPMSDEAGSSTLERAR